MAPKELVNIHTAFHQQRYPTVIAYDTSSLSPANALPARILKLRARLQLSQHSAVISELNTDSSSSPDLAAVHAFAQYDADPSSASALDKATELSREHSENLTVQLLAGTVLFRAGQRDEALALLSKHQGSLDAVALIVQVHLASHRADLAAQEVRRARSWAQDHLLVNIAEAWVQLREGGQSRYQSAFYVFEELATAPGDGSATALIAQAVAEMHLGRWEEAEAAVGEALKKAEGEEGKERNGDVFADAVVLRTIMGRGEEAAQAREKLEKLTKGGHPMLEELGKKRELFESAKGKYNPVFEVEA